MGSQLRRTEVEESIWTDTLLTKPVGAAFEAMNKGTVHVCLCFTPFDRLTYLLMAFAGELQG